MSLHGARVDLAETDSLKRTLERAQAAAGEELRARLFELREPPPA